MFISCPMASHSNQHANIKIPLQTEVGQRSNFHTYSSTSLDQLYLATTDKVTTNSISFLTSKLSPWAVHSIPLCDLISVSTSHHQSYVPSRNFVFHYFECVWTYPDQMVQNSLDCFKVSGLHST